MTTSGLDIDFVISKLKNYERMLKEDIDKRGSRDNPEPMEQQQLPNNRNKIIEML